MTNEADLVAGVRRRFAETDTDVLRAMWGSEDRTDWAEAALRDELIARGDSPEVLDAIAARREEIAANAPPDAKELRWEYGIQGRLLTMAAVFLWCFLVHVTVRWPPLAWAGSTAIIAVYAYLLTKRTARQAAHPSNGVTRFAWGWQLFWTWAFVAFAAIGMLFSFF